MRQHKLRLQSSFTSATRFVVFGVAPAFGLLAFGALAAAPKVIAASPNAVAPNAVAKAQSDDETAKCAVCGANSGDKPRDKPCCAAPKTDETKASAKRESESSSDAVSSESSTRFRDQAKIVSDQTHAHEMYAHDATIATNTLSQNVVSPDSILSDSISSRVSSSGVRTANEKPTASEKWAAQLWIEADEAFHSGDYPRAIVKFRAITVIAPTDVEAYGVGAWLMWSVGNGDEATAFMRRAVANDAQNWEMWAEAGDHFTVRKILPLETQQFYARALALAPKDADTRLTRHRLAFAAETNGDFATAQRVWNEVAQEFSNDNVAARKSRELQARGESKTATTSTR